MSDRDISFYTGLDDTPIVPTRSSGCGGRCSANSDTAQETINQIQELMRAHGLGGDVVSNVRLLLAAFEAHRTNDAGAMLIADVRKVSAKQN